MSVKTIAPLDVVATDPNVRRLMMVRALAVSMGFGIPVLVHYWEGFGLSFGQVLLLEALFHVTWLMLDIPLGYLADVWGRKKAILLGAVCLLGGGVSYTLANGIELLVAGEMLLAAGHACIAGADQALLRATLRRQGREEADYRRLWGYAQALEMGSATLTCLVGTALFLVHPRLPFVAASLFFTYLFFVALGLKEEERGSVQTGKGHIREMFRIAKESVWVNKRLRWVMLLNAFIAAMLNFMMFVQAKYLVAAGVNIANNGWIFAGLGLTAALVATWSSRSQKVVNRQRFAAETLGLIALCLVALWYHAGWIGLIFLMGLQVSRALARVYCQDWVRQELKPSEHATGSSVSGAVFRVVFISLVLLTTKHFDVWTAQQGCLALACIALTAGVLLVITCPFKRDAVTPKQT